MSRMEFNSPDRATKVLDGLYKDMERRINSSLYGLCPVEMSKAFLHMCHAQSCGKCSPCRIGLGQLANLMDDVLSGKADESILDVLAQTAQTIVIQLTAPSVMRQHRSPKRVLQASVMITFHTSEQASAPSHTDSLFPA